MIPFLYQNQLQNVIAKHAKQVLTYCKSID